jgi:hypothetical protein
MSPTAGLGAVQRLRHDRYQVACRRNVIAITKMSFCEHPATAVRSTQVRAAASAIRMMWTRVNIRYCAAVVCHGKVGPALIPEWRHLREYPPERARAARRDSSAISRTSKNESVSQPSRRRRTTRRFEFCDNVPNRCFETSSVLSAMIALRLLGDKDLLGGNSVRAVAHPAPQRQLD